MIQNDINLTHLGTKFLDNIVGKMAKQLSFYPTQMLRDALENPSNKKKTIPQALNYYIKYPRYLRLSNTTLHVRV
jgi:hypothetical protein